MWTTMCRYQIDKWADLVFQVEVYHYADPRMISHTLDRWTNIEKYNTKRTEKKKNWILWGLQTKHQIIILP